MKAKAAQLHVETLEDRLAPATSLLTATMTKPALPPGTIGIDQALPARLPGHARPRGFIFNGLGPMQISPAAALVVMAALPAPRTIHLPQQARAIDPGTGGGQDLASLSHPHDASSIIHTSFWQAIGLDAPGADDAWLGELIRVKQTGVSPSTNSTPQAPPKNAPGEWIAPESGPYEESTQQTPPQESVPPTNDEFISPAAQAQIVCRLAMQARPGYLIAIVLLLGWTACEIDQRHREGRSGRLMPARRLPGQCHPGKHPELRPWPARAPPTAEPVQKRKGRPRGLPCSLQTTAGCRQQPGRQFGEMIACRRRRF